MKYTEKEILDALNLIKYICSNELECDNCPFADSIGICMIGQEKPDEWKLVNLEPKVFRAFKE